MNKFTRTTAGVLLAVAAISGVTAVGANAALRQPSVYDSISTVVQTLSNADGSDTDSYIPRWRF